MKKNKGVYAAQKRLQNASTKSIANALSHFYASNGKQCTLLGYTAYKLATDQLPCALSKKALKRIKNVYGNSV